MNFYPFFQWLEQSYSSMQTALVAAIRWGIQQVASLFQQLVAWFVGAFAWLWEGLRTLAFGVLSAIWDAIQSVGGLFAHLFDWLWQTFLNTLGDLLLWVDTLLPDPATSVWAALATAARVVYTEAMRFSVLVDWSFVAPCIGATLVLIASIELGKFVWRCIPGVG